VKWLEICVPVESEEAARAVCELFDTYGHGGAVQEQIFQDTCQPAFDGPAPVTIKTYLPVSSNHEHRLQILEGGLSKLAQSHLIPPARIKELAEEDWATVWKSHYLPQHIGRHIVLKLPEQDYAPAEGEVVIDLEPGMAFGTGLHATTRMCLTCLEELVSPGDCLLDMGTGSGVLAIAAARLGAGSVLALDNDPTAVAVARENVARNSVTQAVTVEEGSLDYLGDHQVPPLDGIVANIIADAIVEMMELGLADSLKPGGWLVASGIIPPAEVRVRAALRMCGMQTTGRYQEDDWVTLYGTKPPTNGEQVRTKEDR
jgi:ribosomal protein L11 methyltransferase